MKGGAEQSFVLGDNCIFLEWKKGNLAGAGRIQRRTGRHETKGWAGAGQSIGTLNDMLRMWAFIPESKGDYHSL